MKKTLKECLKEINPGSAKRPDHIENDIFLSIVVKNRVYEMFPVPEYTPVSEYVRLVDLGARIVTSVRKNMGLDKMPVLSFKNSSTLQCGYIKGNMVFLEDYSFEYRNVYFVPCDTQKSTFEIESVSIDSQLTKML